MPKFGTRDHIFVLKQLLTKYLQNKKYIFACFIDFQKAFDSVWHQGLLFKLRQIGISGNFYKVIKNIYHNSTSTVKTKNGMTKCFPVRRGIRQGDGLSPLLFNIFVNDIKSHIESGKNDPPMLLKNRLSCLLYADDLVLLSETNSGSQNAINNLQEYCKQWKLHINITKSKSMIFNESCKLLNNFKLMALNLKEYWHIHILE